MEQSDRVNAGRVRAGWAGWAGGRVGWTALTSGTIECNKASLYAEGCPNLQCQRFESSVTVATIQAFAEPPELREDKLEMIFITDFGRMAKDVDCRV